MNNNMHIENMENLLEKMDMHKKDEKVLFGELKNQLRNINYSFDNSSSNTFNEKIDDLCNKFTTISKIHDNNYVVINKNIEKYLSNSVKVSQMFDNINK